MKGVVKKAAHMSRWGWGGFSVFILGALCYSFSPCESLIPVVLGSIIFSCEWLEAGEDAGVPCVFERLKFFK